MQQKREREETPLTPLSEQPPERLLGKVVQRRKVHVRAVDRLQLVVQRLGLPQLLETVTSPERQLLKFA